MGLSTSKQSVASPAAVPTNSPSALPDLQDFLLQPPPDSSIRQSWTLLDGLIGSHVDSFYAAGPVSISFRDLSDQIRNSYNISSSQREAEGIADLLLSSPTHRKLGLRICIARILLASTDMYGDPAETALDKGTVEMLVRFKALNPNMSPEEQKALATWRMVTAFFLHRAKRDPNATSNCIQALREFLEPFTAATTTANTTTSHHEQNNETTSAQYVASLQQLCQEAVEIGESLFCHAAEWNVDWRGGYGTVPAGESDASLQLVVVFPALYRSSKRRDRTALLIQEAHVVSVAILSRRSSSPSSMTPGVLAGKMASRKSTGDSFASVEQLESEDLHASLPKPLSRRSTYDHARKRRSRGEVVDRRSEPASESRKARR